MLRTRISLLFSAWCLLCAGGVGCHHHRTTDEQDKESQEEEPFVPRTLLLEVENHNWSDVVIYLLVEGKRHRFLNVTGTKDVSKEIPLTMQGSMGQLRFAIHRIGTQNEYVTEQVSIRTGRTIRLTIESKLERSSIAVF